MTSAKTRWAGLCLSLAATATLLFAPPALAQDELDLSEGVSVPSAEELELAKYFPQDVVGHWAEETMLDLVHAEVISGYAENSGETTLRPNNPITRAEFVTLLVRALHLQAGAATKTFTDVRPTDWHHPYVTTAASLGLVSGTGAAFEPTRNITRDEIAAIIARAFEATLPTGGTPKTFTDVPNYWAKPAIDRMSAVGIINGYANGTFGPRNQATRAESMLMMRNALAAEQGHLPDKALLTQLIVRQQEESFAAMKGANWPRFHQLNEHYNIGYYRTLIGSMATVLSSIPPDPNLRIDYELSGTPTATIVESSDRFAVVDARGVGLTMIVSGPEGEIYRDEQPSDERLYVRKLPDGTWKIYSMHALNGPEAP